MKRLLLLSCLVLLSSVVFSQGANNEQKIDSEDFENVFDLQNIHVFKYPFHVKQGEYISVSYEVYEFGKLQERIDLFNNFKRENNLLPPLIASKDTTVLYRFYFINKNKTIEAEVLPCSSISQKFNISKVKSGGYISGVDITDNLSGKTLVVYYVGNYKDNPQGQKTHGRLRRFGRMTLKKLIKNNDYVIMFFANRVSA